LDDAPSDRGLGKSLELMGTEILALEPLAQQLPRLRGNQNRIGLRHALQSRRKIGGLTDDSVLFGGSGPSDVSGDDEAACYADPHRQGDASIVAQ
jgi:hypothetical protein